MSKQRSPNYPGHHLGDAIQDVKKLFKKEGQTTFAESVASTHLGYKSFSGPARVRLAAMKQYGLLEQKGKGEVCLSGRALTILTMDSTNPEHQEAVHRAALAPPIFDELYREKRSASDDSIRHTLIVVKKFTGDGATNCLRVWRATMEFARMTGQSESGLIHAGANDNLSGQDEGNLSETETLQVGDYVQATINDQDQFHAAAQIKKLGVSPQGEPFALFDPVVTTTGVPVKQLRKCAPPSSTATPPSPVPSSAFPMNPTPIGGTTMQQQYPIPLGGGAVAVLILPDPITEDMYQNLQDLIERYKPLVTSKAHPESTSELQA